jgi:hypothetical protein
LPFASRAAADNWRVPPTAALALVGLTVTEATVLVVVWLEVTAIVALPVLFPDVARMVAVPAEMPVTRPAEETVATDEFELDHVTAWPVSVLPLSSLTVALSSSALVTCTLELVGDTVTDATVGKVVTVPTVTETESSSEPDAARIFTVPFDSPLTTPFETVATVVFVELHDTSVLSTRLPYASSAVALNVVVLPTGTEAGFGEIVSDVACCETTTVLVSALLQQVAFATTRVLPGALAVTLPLSSTVAIEGARLVQSMLALGTRCPFSL